MISGRILIQKFLKKSSGTVYLGLWAIQGACVSPAQQNGAIDQATGNEAVSSGNSSSNNSSSVDTGSGANNTASNTPPAASTPTPAASTNGNASCYTDTFTQPDEQIARSVDLLLVVDTSGSMENNRVGVAQGLSAFVAELPANVDYRVGVLLAHGSQSKYSGKLWAPANAPRVISSKDYSTAKIQDMLTKVMMSTPADPGLAQGETGLFAITQLLSKNMADAKSAGFFRSDAALAVVFISDENDVCAVYPEHPATQTGLTSGESAARKLECPNGIPAEQVALAIKNAVGEKPSIIAAVVNNDIKKSYTGNDGYGWGYMDLVEKTHGISIDIEKGNYVLGLASVGQLVTKKLELITEHTLQHSQDVDASTVHVSVDGRDAASTYEPTTTVVHLTQPGTAKSVVEIDYCSIVTPPVSGGCVGSSCTSGGGVFGI